MSEGHIRFPGGIHLPTDLSVPLSPSPASSFEPKLLLVQFLDGFTGSDELGQGALTSALRRSPQSTLSALLNDLPPLQREKLESCLGQQVLRELAQISFESDPELFLEDLLRVANRLEREDRIGPAIALLEEISQAAAVPQQSFPELGARADRDLKAISGQGAAGARFEFLLRRFVRETADPWMIAGFGAGSLAFRAAKLGVFSRLVGRGADGFFSGRLTAGLLASGAGLSAEVPTFVLVSKLGRELSVAPQDWRGETLAHELATTGLTLLFLKGAGAVSGGALKSIRGLDPMAPLVGRSTAITRFADAAVPQVGMFSGIVLARRAEESLGLRDRLEGATLFTDSLATYLQFSLGGRLAERTLGRGFVMRQQEMDLRAASLGRKSLGLLSPAFATAWYGSSTGSSRGALTHELMNAPLLSENNSGDGSGMKPPVGSPLRLVRPGEGVGEADGASRRPNPEPNASEPPRSGAAAPEGRQQILDLSAARVLRSRGMDEKEREFRVGVDSVMLASASQARRQFLDQEVIAKLPPQRREELQQSLIKLHPDLVDIFGSAARSMPWQDLAQVFTEMRLIRTSPGELPDPPPASSLSRPLRESLAQELGGDYQALFQASLPGAPEAMKHAVLGLSEASVNLLGHWSQNSGTRLLTAQRLDLPGLSSEEAIVQAYHRWDSTPPSSK